VRSIVFAFAMSVRSGGLFRRERSCLSRPQTEKLRHAGAGQVVDVRKGPNKTKELFVHFEDCALPLPLSSIVLALKHFVLAGFRCCDTLREYAGDPRCDEWVPESKALPWTEATAAHIARKRPAVEDLPRCVSWA
jgi:hypothetical protein